MARSNMYHVSQSKVNAFRLCRQKHHYKYVKKLRAKKKARPLKFGSIAHEMIDGEAMGKSPFKVLDRVAKRDARLFREEQEMYGDIVTDMRYIMSAYFDYWKDDPIEYIKKNGRMTEIPVEIELVDGILFKGKLDGIAKYRKMKALVEHKSHKVIPNDDERWRNLQSSIYIDVIGELGWGSLDGSLWDYIRSKPPTRPQLLKDGTLSSRQLDSLPQVVMDVIRQNKLKLSEYSALVRSQEENLPSWFQRVFTPVKSKVIKEVKKDFITTAREMADQPKPVRHIGRHCSWCEFEPLCRATLQGNDVDFVIEHAFTTKREDEEQEEVEE